jgi:cytochrome c oxidase subunit 2
MNILILVAVAVGVVAIIQLVRLNEIVSEARGDHSEENLTKQENNAMAFSWIIFMVLFFGFLVWLMFKFGYGGLGRSASVHGEELDSLLVLNYWIILPVFFLTNAILFIFAYKYRYDENRTASYFSHSSKLELVWTIVPAIVLSVVIFMGLKTWKDIMFDAPEEGNPQIVECYAYQFGFTFRIAGENNELGDADYKLISSSNPLGVVTEKLVEAKLAAIEVELKAKDSLLAVAMSPNGEYWKDEKYVNDLLTSKANMTLQQARIKSGLQLRYTHKDSTLKEYGSDDIVMDEDLHMVVNRPVTFKFRSKDVIHSAYFPHFRAQMNCVPGQPTEFTFTPKYTTKEFAELPEVQSLYEDINVIHNERKRRIGEEEEQVDFNYILLCNKICGASHSNMQKNIIVDTEADYEVWYECKDWQEAIPVDPRLDVAGNPVVYNGFAGEDAEGFNKVNMAAVNKAKAEAAKALKDAGALEVDITPLVTDTNGVLAVVGNQG